MKKNIFSDNFNNLLASKKIVLKDLSEKTGIRTEKLSKFKNAENPVQPSVDDLIKISEFFNVSIDDLLGYSKHENPQSIMLNFITSLLKLQEYNYMDVEISRFLGSGLSNQSKEFLSSEHHKKLFPQYKYVDNETSKIKITLDKPHPDFQCMYHDIISKTLLESEDLISSLPYLKSIWLADRIKKLDELYHFDEQPNENKSTENETKDSE